MRADHVLPLRRDHHSRIATRSVSSSAAHESRSSRDWRAGFEVEPDVHVQQQVPDAGEQMVEIGPHEQRAR